MSKLRELLRPDVAKPNLAIDDTRKAMAELESSQQVLRDKLDTPYPFTGPLRSERQKPDGRRVGLSQ